MRKLRKVYVIVENNRIFGSNNFEAVDLYRSKSYADSVCASKNRMALDDANKFWNKNEPVKKYHVHAFYLLHEDLLKE
ncbi:hypothetical protein EOD41_10760 [Mucilaginibacter limnophilus]|uniref:Uncharacterized protein n=1 Tax=Mucilaginibacter limnophilus TaxID=1932778 RepID=A0A3S2UPC7_9SPHI|nr:hypothetical protein [Mucilaginibacter limnophilus]RVU01086.1 hypothetical protein EOD41_10760 [Mucilaginibacter limnophilus]